MCISPTVPVSGFLNLMGDKKIKKTASMFRTRTPAIEHLSCQGVSCNLNYVQWYYFPISTDTVRVAI